MKSQNWAHNEGRNPGNTVVCPLPSILLVATSYTFTLKRYISYNIDYSIPISLICSLFHRMNEIKKSANTPKYNFTDAMLELFLTNYYRSDSGLGAPAAIGKGGT